MKTKGLDHEYGSYIELLWNVCVTTRDICFAFKMKMHYRSRGRGYGNFTLKIRRNGAGILDVAMRYLHTIALSRYPRQNA